MRFAKLTTLIAASFTLAVAPTASAQSVTPSNDGTASATLSPAGIQPASPSSGDTITIYRKIHPNRPVLFTGLGVFAASYAPLAIVQAANGRSEDNNLYIPVVGPWINLGERNCEGCANEDTNRALIITSGVAQSAGLALAISSLFIPEKVEAATIKAGPVRMLIAPTAVGSAGGVGAVGTF